MEINRLDKEIIETMRTKKELNNEYESTENLLQDTKIKLKVRQLKRKIF